MMYPTKTMPTGFLKIRSQKAIKMVSGRQHTVDIKNLEYHKQKKFFRLDREYDQNLVEQHKWKLKNTADKAQQAMQANLKRERLRLFRQYITEQKEKNSEINKTLMTSKIPLIQEALIGISEQSYQTGKSWLEGSSRLRRNVKSIKS